MSIAAPHFSNPWLLLGAGAAILLRHHIRTAFGVVFIAVAVLVVRMPEEDRRDAVRAVLAKELATAPREQDDPASETT